MTHSLSRNEIITHVGIGTCMHAGLCIIYGSVKQCTDGWIDAYSYMHPGIVNTVVGRVLPTGLFAIRILSSSGGSYQPTILVVLLLLL